MTTFFNIISEAECLAVLEEKRGARVAGNLIGMLALDQGGWMQKGSKAEGSGDGVLSEPLREQGVSAMM